MAKEIWHFFPSGENLDTYVLKKTDGKVFDVSDGGDTFETWSDSNVLNYFISMTDNGDGYYTADFPSVITLSGVYRIVVKQRAGGSAAAGDLKVAQGEFSWGGIQEIDTLTLSAQGSKVLNVYKEV